MKRFVSAEIRQGVRRFALNAAAVVIGIVAALVIAELVLRLTGYSDPVFMVTDYDRGWALSPGAEGWYADEGSAYFKVNREGLHDDREYSKDKPPNTIRVAVLGDSFTEAKQVPMAENFCSVIERQLAQCPAVRGKRVEVLNFGVAGYGTTQELITLRRHVWDYSPDIVVLAFYPGNDILDNSPQTSIWTQMRPFFVKHDGGWELGNSFRNLRHFRHAAARETGFGRWLHNHLRLIQLFEASRQYMKSAGSGGGFGLVAQTYRDTPELRDAWDVTFYMLSTMSREVEAHHSLFLITTLGSPIAVNSGPRARQEFAQKYGVSDVLYPDKRIASWAADAGIPELSLAEPFQRYAQSHNETLYFSKGHFSAAGHRLAGSLISEQLCRMLDREDRGGRKPAQ